MAVKLARSSQVWEDILDPAETLQRVMILNMYARYVDHGS